MKRSRGYVEEDMEDMEDPPVDITSTDAYRVLHPIAAAAVRNPSFHVKELERFLLDRLRDGNFDHWWSTVKYVCEQDWFFGCLSDRQLDRASFNLLDASPTAYFAYFSHGEPGHLTVVRRYGSNDTLRDCCENAQILRATIDKRGLDTPFARADCSDVFKYIKP